MSCETVGPKSNCQEPGGSIYYCLTFSLKKTCPKSSRKEPVGSTYQCLTLVLRKICHVCTQNNITAPSINDTHKTDITQNFNSLHQKYADITNNMWTSEHVADL